MLKDQDRIFTNIYGLQDPGLPGAGARRLGRHQDSFLNWAAKKSSR